MWTRRKGEHSALSADGAATETTTQWNRGLAVGCSQAFSGKRKQRLVWLIVDLQGKLDGEEESLLGGCIVVFRSG
jgi:hypothetical protein